MKFTVKRREFVTALKKVTRFAARHNLPVLLDVLIEAWDGKVSLTCSNLIQHGRRTIAAEVDQPVRLLVSAARLLKAVQYLPDEVIEIGQSRERERWVGVVSGDCVQNLFGRDVDDFPSLMGVDPNAPRFEIAAATFRRIAKSVTKSARKRDVGGIVTNCLIGLQGDVAAFVCTDTHRLNRQACTITPVAEPAEWIVPSDAMVLFANGIDPKSDETLTIQADDDCVRFSMGSMAMVTRRIKAKFPDCQKLFTPFVKSEVVRVVVDRQALQCALKVVGSSAVMDQERAEFLFRDGCLTISANEHDSSALFRVRDVAGFGPSEGFRCAFNYRYALEILSTLDGDKTDILFTKTDERLSPVLPVLIRQHGVFDCRNEHILMPMSPREAW